MELVPRVDDDRAQPDPPQTPISLARARTVPCGVPGAWPPAPLETSLGSLFVRA